MQNPFFSTVAVSHRRLGDLVRAQHTHIRTIFLYAREEVDDVMPLTLEERIYRIFGSSSESDSDTESSFDVEEEQENKSLTDNKQDAEESNTSTVTRKRERELLHKELLLNVHKITTLKF